MNSSGGRPTLRTYDMWWVLLLVGWCWVLGAVDGTRRTSSFSQHEIPSAMEKLPWPSNERQHKSRKKYGAWRRPVTADGAAGQAPDRGDRAANSVSLAQGRANSNSSSSVSRERRGRRECQCGSCAAHAAAGRERQREHRRDARLVDGTDAS